MRCLHGSADLRGRGRRGTVRHARRGNVHAELLRRGGAYAKVYEQQFQGGRVEAVCEDGMVLASGEVVAATPAA